MAMAINLRLALRRRRLRTLCSWLMPTMRAESSSCNRARGKFPDGAEKVIEVEAGTERGSTNYKVSQALSEITSQIERLQKSIAAKSKRTGKGQQVPRISKNQPKSAT